MALGLTTKLQAVNRIIATIGESPINSLSGQKRADAVIAESVLDEVTVEVQARGWHFNTEKDVELTPDSVSGEIAISTNVAKIDLEAKNEGSLDITIRKSKLYDLKEHTYIFTDAVKATVVYILEFDEIPQAARDYIAVRSARLFQDRMVGSKILESFTLRDEFQTYAHFKQTEGDNADRTIFDNFAVYRTVNRPSVSNRL